MAAGVNYGLIWLIYLAAGLVFYGVFWRATRFRRARLAAYSLRAAAAALVFTPWYVNMQESIMAPALMVMALDLITIGPQAAVRAAIPLVLAVIAAQLAATVFYFYRRRGGL